MTVMREIKKVCVYCGSSSGSDPVYREVTERLGHYLAEQKISLIYGGAKIGLMGALADAVLAGDGEVVGVIPHHLVALEVSHTALTSLITVDSMHARKHQLAELADAFIALPGGIGTTEELLEMLTWLQLKLHAKPVGLLNTNGYYDHLLSFLDHMTTTGFLKKEHRAMLMVAEKPETLFDQMSAFVPPDVSKVS